MSSSEFNFKNARQATIPISKIRENAEALRTVVDKESEGYQQGLDSVKKRGIMLPILVREIVDPATNEPLFGLIDGLHRFNWAMDAGLTEIPAQIGSLEEADLLEAQILANVHKIETKPVQYTKALLQILGSNPALTILELAGRLSRSTSWLNERLGLLKLTPEIQKLVDDGSLVLTNAYALAKLPADKQPENLQAALSKSPAEFVPFATNIQKEVAKARREGRAAETDKFMPVARLKRVAEIKDETDYANKQPEASKVIAAAKANGVTTVEAAIAYALNWTLHLDPVSIATDEAKWKQAKADREKAAKDRADAKERAKAAAAATVPA